MTPIKPSQLKTLLAAAIKEKLPVLITGKPGVGKSDIVAEACQDANADLQIAHPAVEDPTDSKGMPWVKDGKAEFIPFGDLRKLIDAKRLTACFLDDLGQASPAVQAARMQLVLSRRVNGHKVSDHVVFLAATNRRQDRAGVNGILEPLKSRFATIVELEADAVDWRAWAASAGVAPEVIAFIAFRPELLSNFQPTSDMTNSPCPRTWVRVSQLLALNLPADLQIPTIQGAVGEAAAVEFVSFLRVWQAMVSPDVVLTSPDTAPIPDEPSAMYALMTALAYRVRKDSMGRYCKYLGRLNSGGHSEFAALSLKAALARDSKLSNTPGYISAMSGPLGQLLLGA